MLMLKIYVHFTPMEHGKIKIQTIPHGYQDCLVPNVVQDLMSKIVLGVEYDKTDFLS
jgi:hypothetical protein